MAVFKHGSFVDDPWRMVDPDADGSGDGPLIVSFDRWQTEPHWRGRNAPTGVHVTPGAKLDKLEHELAGLPLIAVEFPKFTDGRGYSLARRLRERRHFTGELRAVGDVLLDQLQLMQRCGFDAFEIADQATLAALRQGRVAGLTHFYQPGAGLGEVPAGTRPWLRSGDRS